MARAANERALERTRPAEISAVERLARALQRHRIYPHGSPLCREAAEEAREALSALPEASVELRVDPDGLRLDGEKLRCSSAAEELAERLFRADLGAVTLRSDAPGRELGRFCRQLAGWDRRAAKDVSFPEALAEQGVMSVAVRTAERLDILDIGIFSAQQIKAVARDRERSRPDPSDENSVRCAWLRVDTDAEGQTLDLLDLALLVEDQSELAEILGGAGDLTARSADPADVRSAIRQLTQINAALSQEQADQRFKQLADLVMQIDPEIRRSLTRDVFLPDLLEGGASGHLLRRLPDTELLGALGGLTELEIGAPGLVELALDRLGLSEDREKRVGSTLRDAIRARTVGSFGTEEGVEPAPVLDARALQTDGGPRDLRELTARDLSVQPETEREFERLCHEIEETVEVQVSLRRDLDLLGHVRNPDAALQIAEGARTRLELLMERDLATAAGWVEEVRQIAAAAWDARPEIAQGLEDMLGRLCTPGFVRDQVARWQRERGADEPHPDFLTSFGQSSARAFVQALEGEEERAVRRGLVDYMCEHARALAPGLTRYLGDARWTVVRNAVRALGFAGPGHEADIAPLAGHAEPRVAREAFLALARIGTAEAAEIVVDRLNSNSGRSRELAEEALWLFPAEEAGRQARALLARLDFCRARPELARQLVQEFLLEGTRQDREVLRTLSRFKWQLWRPGLARLGWTAARPRPSRPER